MADKFDKIYPNSIEGEMAVLGAMLIEREAIPKVLEIVNEKHLYKESHKRIFNIIQALYLKNQPVDTITVTEQLKKENILSDIGGVFYLTELINTVSTAANVEYYANIVYEKFVLRQLILFSTKIAEEAYRSSDDPDVLLNEAEQMIFSIARARDIQGFTHIKNLAEPTLQRIEMLMTEKKPITGVPTGYTEIDNMTTGLQPANLIIIAGRPSMGKTSLAMNIVANAAIRNKIAIGVFSLEMSKQELMFRLVCSEARVNAHEVRAGMISKKSWTPITNSLSIISESPIYIDDSSDVGILEMMARARRLVTDTTAENNKLGMIVIDYIQLMRGLKKVENRQQEIAEISRALKSLARELYIPIIAISQLSRRTEEHGREGRPKLSDLRESGALEQDADLVMFIVREEVYKKDVDLENKAKIIIAKQRNGPTGEIDLIFNKHCTRFEPMDTHSG